MRRIELVDGKKACTGCGETKGASEFYPRRRKESRTATWDSRCKECESKRRAASADPDYKRAHYEKNRRRQLDQSRRRVYGISREQYDEMLKRQGGVCAICRQPESNRNRRGEICELAVDHDHDTAQVRGLLCGDCNRGLGCFRESPSRILGALAYLGENQ